MVKRRAAGLFLLLLVLPGCSGKPSALEEAVAAIEHNPEDATAWAGRGLVYAAQRKYEQALVNYDQAVKLTPDKASVYLDRGHVYRLQRKFALAIEDCNTAIRLEP